MAADSGMEEARRKARMTGPGAKGMEEPLREMKMKMEMEEGVERSMTMTMTTKGRAVSQMTSTKGTFVRQKKDGRMEQGRQLTEDERGTSGDTVGV